MQWRRRTWLGRNAGESKENLHFDNRFCCLDLIIAFSLRQQTIDLLKAKPHGETSFSLVDN